MIHLRINLRLGKAGLARHQHAGHCECEEQQKGHAQAGHEAVLIDDPDVARFDSGNIRLEPGQQRRDRVAGPGRAVMRRAGIKRPEPVVDPVGVGYEARLPLPDPTDSDEAIFLEAAGDITLACRGEA
jgi:hypothetical protein